MLLGVCMATGCTHTVDSNVATHNVPLGKYMDLDQLEQLCKSDTLHNKALIFCHPYCGGCIHRFKEWISPAIKEADTTLWRFYYLIVVDSTDTLRYNDFMSDCRRMGIDTNKAYIWRLDWTKEDYNKVFSLFHSTHSLENSAEGIPWTILLDRRNYISNQKMFFEDKRDSIWYGPRDLDTRSVHLEDFSVDDPEWYIMVSYGK